MLLSCAQSTSACKHSAVAINSLYVYSYCTVILPSTELIQTRHACSISVYGMRSPCCAVASDIRKRIALKWSAYRVRPRGFSAPQLGSNYQADNQADTSADTSVRTIRPIIKLILQLIKIIKLILNYQL